MPCFCFVGELPTSSVWRTLTLPMGLATKPSTRLGGWSLFERLVLGIMTGEHRHHITIGNITHIAHRHSTSLNSPSCLSVPHVLSHFVRQKVLIELVIEPWLPCQTCKMDECTCRIPTARSCMIKSLQLDETFHYHVSSELLVEEAKS